MCPECEAWHLRRADELALAHRALNRPPAEPLVEPPTEYDDARQRAGLVDEDEVVDQGGTW